MKPNSPFLLGGLVIASLAVIKCGNDSPDATSIADPNSVGAAGRNDSATGGASGRGDGLGGSDNKGGANNGGANKGGANNGGAGNGGMNNGGSADGAIDAGVRRGGGCSEMNLRTGPPAGKEAFKKDPIDTKFPFSTHWMGVFSDDPRFVSMTSLTDLDNDGDLDFASGQREDLNGGMVWWEYCSADHWVKHTVGIGYRSSAGGNAMDVDGDGWVDLLAGDSWFKNPKTPRTSTGWQRYTAVPIRPEELIVGDLTGDKKPEVLYLISTIKPQWWSPGPDPTQQWVEGGEYPYNQQQGGAIGDIDGDGDNDIVGGREWWYRNVSGDGKQWENVHIDAGVPFDEFPLTWVGDIDGDGDNDIVLCTHFGGRVAWLENLDGKGNQWKLHMIATTDRRFHSIVAADFDNDGDIDLFIGENYYGLWIYENTDGKGTFAEHKIAVGPGHEARVGDVDCDGDLDIAGKPWGDLDEGNNPRDHVYYQNMLVERGGKPVFNRPKGEVWNYVQNPACAK